MNNIYQENHPPYIVTMIRPAICAALCQVHMQTRKPSVRWSLFPKLHNKFWTICRIIFGDHVHRGLIVTPRTKNGAVLWRHKERNRRCLIFNSPDTETFPAPTLPFTNVIVYVRMHTSYSELFSEMNGFPYIGESGINHHAGINISILSSDECLK